MIEIERRALLNEKEFNRVLDYLNKEGQSLGKRSFVSYLFREPGYLRIRVEGKKITITEKAGDYEDIGREEKTTEISYEKIKDYVKELQKKGFQRCAKVETERESYNFKGVTVELNKIDVLGLIVEVEAMTEDEKEKEFLDARVRETLKLLGLKELPAASYKKMMEKVYDNALDVSESTLNKV